MMQLTVYDFEICGVAMATQCQHDLSHTRRLAMKKELSPGLAALCNTAIQSGEFLEAIF